jgi:CHAT domain-containing protein/tetratricopeptide (TPR) repeat protein
MIGAREALRLADAEPARAAELAASVTRAALRKGDQVSAAVAERAWGLAVRQVGDLDSAIVHLSRAVQLGGASGAWEVAGEARTTLAFALSERGRPRRALEEIGRALYELDGAARARALVQQGTILLELGRYDRAMDSYREALPVLRAAGDRLSTYRVVANRGLAQAYRHAFAGAESDLREAERLAGELGLPLAVGFAQANLAFVLGLRGEVIAALEYSTRAEERIRAHRAQIGELLKDRSELLLSVRLVSEARETAEHSIAEYERERRGIKLPQVRLVLAQAALLDGDVSSALVHARRAAREFARQERPEWAAVARLTVLRAEDVDGRRSPAGLRLAEHAVTTLEQARWPSAAVEARLVAASLLQRRGRPERAALHLQEAAKSRVSGPAMLRARGWYAEALHRAESGHRRGAYSAAAAGLRILDEHRAALGATDMRARAAGHRTQLAELGLRLALSEGRPRRAFEWAERGRATDLSFPRPPRPPDQPEIAQALAELRGIAVGVNQLRSTGAGGAEVTALLQQQAALERQVRDRFRRRRAAGGQSTARLSTPGLLEDLGEAALVEFVVLDGAVLALTLVAGRTRLHRLGSMREIDEAINRMGFALRRLLRRGADPASRSAARQLLQGAAQRADRLLMAPLPEIADRPLVLVPTGSLQCIPWAALPTCAGRPVTVAPSAALWQSSSRRPASESGHVLVTAGPDLPGAEGEARTVAAVHGVRPLLPPAATVGRVLAELEGAALVHLAAHGRLVAHNPLFSDLLLSDGPLVAYDIEHVRRPPHTVVLAACESARTVVCAGDELLGLSATFLAAGTSQLVATVLPVLDLEAAPVMVALHELMAAGLPPAEALTTAQRRVDEEDDAACAAAACFVCMGAGFSAPLPPGSASAGDRQARRAELVSR